MSANIPHNKGVLVFGNGLGGGIQKAKRADRWVTLRALRLLCLLWACWARCAGQWLPAWRAAALSRRPGQPAGPSAAAVEAAARQLRWRLGCKGGGGGGAINTSGWTLQQGQRGGGSWARAGWRASRGDPGAARAAALAQRELSLPPVLCAGRGKQRRLPARSLPVTNC